MIEFISDYGLFLAKSITIVVAILITVGGIVAISLRNQQKGKEHIEVKHLNQRYDDIALTLQSAILPKKKFKQLLKEQKKQHKHSADTPHRRLFVLNFHGDIRANAVASLREEITAVLTVASSGDEVLVRLESAGGLVHACGLAASQLQRLKAHNVTLTVAVDKVAASGGYLMACVADRIIAAPFAVIGSIGVLAQLPNFNRWLKKNEIDFEQFTAGEFKRTVTVFGENTPQGREKFQQDLEETHALFKEFVSTHRNQLDIAQVATGEHWYGKQALDLKLVDDLQTSDDYLLDSRKDAELYEIIYSGKKTVLGKLLGASGQLLDQCLGRLRNQLPGQAEDDWSSSLPRL